MGAMEAQLKEVLASLQHINANMATKSEMAAIQADVAETKEIVAAWRSVKLWASFLRWVAGILTAGGIMFAAVKGVWHR